MQAKSYVNHLCQLLLNIIHIKIILYFLKENRKKYQEFVVCQFFNKIRVN